MRFVAIAAAAALLGGVASVAQAAPATVTVRLGPDLQSKAEKTYGSREVQELADRLKAEVERSLVESGRLDGAQVELVLVDVVPNRPTFKQLADRPGLSAVSFGVGGARIQGQVLAEGGQVTPVNYRYYETDIRFGRESSTWHDAEWMFDRFAHKLARGELVASR